MTPSTNTEMALEGRPRGVRETPLTKNVTIMQHLIQNYNQKQSYPIESSSRKKYGIAIYAYK